MTDLRWTQHMNRRQVLRSAGIGSAGLAAAALVGCSAAPTKSGSAPAPASTAAQTSASAPKTGGRLSLPTKNDPATFDMHASSTVLTTLATAPAYNQLVQYDPKDGDEPPDAIVPDLAQKWEISPDGMTYTFTLVKNAKFHDGTPFTSADAKASLESNQNPPKGLTRPRGPQLRPVKAYETPDDYTLSIKLSRPMSPLSMLPILGQSWMSMYSKKDIDGKFDFKTKFNGTGPYRLASYVRGNKVSFDRNKDYHVKDRPYLDGMDVFIIPNDATQVANIQSGAIHLSTQVGKLDIESLLKSMGDKATSASIPSYSPQAYNFNARRGIFGDKRVRQAASLSTNKVESIQIITRGDATLGGYMPPSGRWTLTPEEIAKIPGYQPFSDAGVAEAKKLLSAAGVQDGAAVNVLTENQKDTEAQALFIVEQFKRVGFKAVMVSLETVPLYERMGKFEFDIVAVGGGAALDDPDAIFSEYYLKDSSRNFAGLSVPAVDDLFVKQSMELDSKKRFEMVKDMQKLAMPEFQRIQAYWRNRNLITNKVAHGYTLHASSFNNSRYEDVWLDR